MKTNGICIFQSQKKISTVTKCLFKKYTDLYFEFCHIVKVKARAWHPF